MPAVAPAILDHRGEPVKTVRSEPVAGSTPLNLRRWESAETNRLNSAHWVKARGGPINSDLALDWETLCDRSTHEAENNPVLATVISTWNNDWVGADGPTLEIQSDSTEYNDWVEEVWNAWWNRPDIEGRLTGPDLLRLFGRQEWTCGEYLYQFVNDSSAMGVQLRVKVIHPRYMQTPPGQTSDDRIVMGVERDDNGRPVRYWIVRKLDQGVFTSYYGTPEPINADLIGHEPIIHEPDQTRGVPLAASVLPVLADIRDADQQVLDAYRMAADFAIALFSRDVDAVAINPGSSVEWERRAFNTLPPGWEAMQIKPEHPSVNYIEWRDEKLREAGAPVNMPLMKVKHDAGDHNFSSAKFDSGSYWRTVECQQKRVERRTLNRMLAKVINEAALFSTSTGRRIPDAPRRVRPTWNWPPSAKVDPRVEAIAMQIERATGGLTLTDIAKSHGKTIEQLADQLVRERRVFTERGIPYPEPQGVIDTVTANAQVEAEQNNQNQQEPEVVNAN